MAVACAALLLLPIFGCTHNHDSGKVVRNIAATPSRLKVGDVAVVEVLAISSDEAPLRQNTIYLTAVPTTAGEFSANAVETNAIGIATATFTARQSGSVLLGASVESNPNILYTSVTIEGEVTGSDFGQITLTIAPSRLPADGRSTATILAKVSDNEGNPVADSTPVKFAAGEKFSDVNGDGIWSEHVDSLVYDADADGHWDPLGVVDPFAYTKNGRATATFTTGNTSGLVYIKVTARDVEHRISGDIALSLTSNDSIYSIALTPESQRIQVRGTGGIEWVRIVAGAFDEFGNPAPEGLPIEFYLTAGPGGGESIDGDGVGPATVFTNSLGQAEVTLNAGTISGTVSVRARSGEVVSIATQVTIRSGPAAFISLSAEDCNVPSWGLVGFNNKITAAVVDQWGNEVSDSTAVHFGTEQGLIEGAAETQIVPTLRGKAVTYWNSGEPRNDPYVHYWCETSGGTVADTNVFIESGPPATGTFLEWPDTLVASGDSLSRVVIEVLDINGVFMDTDSPIDLRADFGTIPPGLINDGCHSSTYVGYYNSEVLDQDYSYTIPDDGVGTIATITANAGGTDGFFGVAKVVLITGRADSRSSTVDVVPAVHYGAFVPVEVDIKDFDGNPLGGHLIEITVQILPCGSGGTITGSPQYTDKYGVASGFIFTAVPVSACNIAYITVRDLDPKYGGLILVKSIILLPD